MGSPEVPARVSRRALLAGAYAMTLTAACSSAGDRPARATGSAHTYSISLPIPPRTQWDGNFGYCGETALISAGLYYGQYLSQFDARGLASSPAPQNREGSQLLLGVNDTRATREAQLDAQEWQPAQGATAATFLTWVKAQLLAGRPVAVGVYTNEYLFYGTIAADAGDVTYDHIVLVTGITSRHRLDGAAGYQADDELVFSDHGLWTGDAEYGGPDVFRCSFAEFPADRVQANAIRGRVYSLPTRRQYGMAFSGVTDPGRETCRVRVVTSAHEESPAIRDGSGERPAGSPLTLTVTASGLQPGTTYALYEYDSVADVPRDSFNARASVASRRWTFEASGASHTVTRTIDSSAEALYRAVPAAGP